ncbi:uncharacterized protein RHO17_003873 [Thomomys bottae]
MEGRCGASRVVAGRSEKVRPFSAAARQYTEVKAQDSIGHAVMPSAMNLSQWTPCTPRVLREGRGQNWSRKMKTAGPIPKPRFKRRRKRRVNFVQNYMPIEESRTESCFTFNPFKLCAMLLGGYSCDGPSLATTIWNLTVLLGKTCQDFINLISMQMEGHPQNHVHHWPLFPNELLFLLQFLYQE